MIPEKSSAKMISEQKKQIHELRLYLKHIRNYKSSLLEIFYGKSPRSLFFKLWKLQDKFLSFVYYPIRKIEEKSLRREINVFSLRERTNFDIYNFGVIPYNFRHLRQQHLVEELAKNGHRVFYIQSYFFPIKRGEEYSTFKIKKLKQNIYIVTLSSLRKIHIYSQKASKKEVTAISASFKKLLETINHANGIAKIDHPFWAYLLPYIKTPIVYDCMEDYEGFAVTEKHILDFEKKLFEKSSLVLVCSNLLRKKFKKYLPANNMLLKNAGEYEHFAKAAVKTYATPEDLKTVKKPIIGFFGALGEFIDAPLLKQVATELNNCSIVLIGEIMNEGIRDLANMHQNVYTLGEKPYPLLPSYLQEFDVCIVPFIVNKSTRLIDPVKFYEYLASGKPIVSSDISEIYQYGDVCYISKNNPEFIANIRKALNEKDKNLYKKRQQVARANTWEVRGNALNSALEALVKHK